MTYGKHVFYEAITGRTLIVYARTEAVAAVGAHLHACMVQAGWARSVGHG